MVENIIILRVDMTSSIPIYNKKTYISILSKGPTQGLDDTTLTAED